MSTSSRKEREKAARRNDIISAAEELFFSNNYDNVSMNDIAKKVELSKATLYLYFDNKESLFFVIVLQGIKIMNSTISKSVDDLETGIEKIRAYITAYYDFMIKYPDYLRLYNYFHSGRFDLTDMVNKKYLNEFVKQVERSTISIVSPAHFPDSNDTSTRLHADYATEIIEKSQELFEILKESVETGINDGSIREDINSAEAAALLTVFINSLTNIRPDIVKNLELNGIDQKKFYFDAEDFIKRMLIK